jgi:tetratricopeptide (TPR) repeat protein
MKCKLQRLLILVTLLLINSISSIVNADLIALWEFDYESAADSCGNNNGTFNGYPVFSAGHAGSDGALELNGNDYISIDNECDFDITDKITVAIWIKVKKFDKAWQAIVTKGDSAWRLARTNQEETVAFHLTGITSNNNGRHQNLGVDGNRNVVDGRWHHIVGVYDGAMISLYVDGILDRAIEATGTIVTNNYKVCIGGNAEREGRCFDGLIDDVAIFDHALSENNVKQLYKMGGASFIPIGYVTGLTEEAEAAIKELKPQDAAVFLEKKISEYEKWRARNISEIKLYDEQLSSDMYFLLARAKEATKAPAQEVIEMYERAVSRPHRPSKFIPAALLWLSEKIPTNEYIDVVKKCIRNSYEPSYYIYRITGFFESKENWSAFELFLDAVLSEVDDPVNYFAVVDKALKKNGAWADKFSQYCKSKPELTGFVFRDYEQNVRNRIEQENFKEAVKIYREIIKQCGPNQNKSIYEFKVCECLFNDNLYQDAVNELDSFIKNNKTTNRTLISKAFMLKGQAYVQLGNVNQAADTFLTLLIEYPETKQAPEANFFIGYCYMLQGRFPEATEAFNLLMKDYPQSSYVAKAESYLSRIKNMTD